MKLTQFYQGNSIHLGVVEEAGIWDVTAHANRTGEALPRDMMEAITFPGTLAVPPDAPLLSPDALTYAPMVTAPQKILCVGLNYKKHIEETGNTPPKTPVLFCKFANALAANGQAIPLPKASHQIDYEAELVMVIGKRCKEVSEAEALSYVFGYTLGNDLSARDLQMRTSQWLIGKSLDGFGPTGPCVVTAECIHPGDLDLSLTVNGQVRQQANTNDLLFDCASIISYASQMMTLMPGDLIFTGTPSGVASGYPAGQEPWLRAGDVVEVCCPNIGILRNTMVTSS